ncbi:MAG: hypothetical protein ACRCUH_15100 [Shewanella sp.]
MATQPTKRLTRPAGAGLDPQLQAIYENLEILNGARGKGLDKAVLVRDLVDLGLATVRKGVTGTYVPSKPNPDGGADGGVVEPPEVPRGVTASGGFSTILVEWSKPTYQGHSYTEILRSDTDDFSAASLVATTAANLYSDQVGGGKIVYYWVRFVNRLDIKGPVQSTNGIRGETQEDIGDILDQLRGKIDSSFMTPVYNSYITGIDTLSKTNSQGIKDIDGKILASKDRIDNLSVSSEILEEAALEAASGVDMEGTKRRKVTAEIKLEQKVIVTELGAQAQQILTITASVGENSAQIQEVKNSVITLDAETNQAVESITQRLDSQLSTINGHTAQINNQSQTLVQISGVASDAQNAANTAQSSADEAAQQAAIAAGIAEGKGKVIIQSAAPNVEDRLPQNLWIDTTGGANTPKRWISGNWIAVTDKTAIDAANAAAAAKAAADQAQADANANAARITAVSETVSTLQATVNGHTASIQNNAQTIVDVNNKAVANEAAVSVLSQQISVVTSDLNGTKSQVTQNSQTIATINANGGSAYQAQWGVKASIGDIQAGIGLTVKQVSGQPPISQCTVIAGQFSVGVAATAGIEPVYPFIVAPHPTTGVPSVFIDTAYIKAARIQDLVAGEVVADNIKVGATLTAPYIKGGRIEIGSTFTVNENGNMVASNATVTGTVNANAGIFNNVTIEENCNVKGTIYANKIVGDVYKAYSISVVSKEVGRNQTVVAFSGTIPRQNFARKVEFGSILIAASFGFTVKYYLNNILVFSIELGQIGIGFTPTPIYIANLAANADALMRVDITTPDNEYGLASIPAGVAKIAAFKD